MNYIVLWAIIISIILVLNHFLWRTVQMNDTVEINCQIKHETEAAFLIDAGFEEPVWIPKSQITHVEEESDSSYTIHMSEWIAKQKDLI